MEKLTSLFWSLTKILPVTQTSEAAVSPASGRLAAQGLPGGSQVGNLRYSRLGGLRYRANCGVQRLGLLFGVLAFCSTALAHRLDEYLQATLVTIAPGEIRLQINLTPGVEVADKVLALVDRDHNGVISTNEALAYCELLKRDLNLQLDGHKIDLKLTASNFPELNELKTGWGIMQMEFTAMIGPLASGAHRVEFSNRHQPSLSVYLFNAAQPKSSQVQITKQNRNNNQSTGEIQFTIANAGTKTEHFDHDPGREGPTNPRF